MQPAEQAQGHVVADGSLADLWKVAAEASEDAVFVVDAQGLVLTWTRSAARLFGRSAEDILGRSSTQLLPADLPGSHRDPIGDVLAGERIERLPVDARRDDGMVVALSLTLVPLGPGRGACLLARDLTEQRAAQATLAESELRLREAQELSQTGLWLWDAGTDTLQLTDEVYRIHGLDPMAFDGTMAAYLELVHPDDRAGLQADLERSVTSRATFEREYRIVCPDGQLGWVYARASIEAGEAGPAVGLRGIARDISERRRLDNELEAARDRAMEVSRLKSEFLATMSHEIRTPMNGVIGMIGLLLDSELDPEQRDYAETARTSGEALLTIINDILDFSKIEAGRLDPEIIDFDLRIVMEEVADLVAEQARSKGLTLAVILPPSVPTAVKGDPGRIRQVLTNLVGNAVKFTAVGEVVVRAELAEESGDELLVRIEVADSGMGIPPEVRPSLFEPFSQADASTTRVYGGTGLGLAISKQLVELMGGEIQVESEVGKGSTFTFTVRLIRQPEHGRAADVVRPGLDGLRVLVVDDSPTSRRVLDRQLTSVGMVTAAAGDGATALEMLREAAANGRPCEVAILDMNMPGVDGVELARAIQAEPALVSTRLVLLTSAGVRGSAEVARQAGIAAFLTKPVQQAQLVDAIAVVMGAGPAAPLVTRHTLAEAKPRSQSRLLVADDNQVNQMVAVAMLGKIGYRADVVANGAEAVDAVARISYGAILMDCRMPEMDGYEAAEEIRRREAGAAHVPIIAMTAGAMKGDRERCLAAGMDDYISKPVKMDDLAATLSRWVSSDAAMAEVRPEPDRTRPD